MHARIPVAFAMTALVASGQPVRQWRAGTLASDITPLEEALAESTHDPALARTDAGWANGKLT